MVEGLQTFVNWWKSFLDSKGIDSAYATWTRPVVQYWEQMVVALKTPCMHEEKAFHDFWPRSLPSPIVALEDAFVNENNFVMDDNEDNYFDSQNKPKDEFNPQVDV